jgi:hypothetical protein
MEGQSFTRSPGSPGRDRRPGLPAVIRRQQPVDGAVVPAGLLASQDLSATWAATRPMSALEPEIVTR